MAAEVKMTLLEHLTELRVRIVKSLLAFAVLTSIVFVVGYEPIKQAVVAPLDALDPNTANPIARYNPVLTFLRPYLSQKPAGPVHLQAIGVYEKFMVKFKMAMLGGLILGAPVILYQMWAFIGAGLLDRERRVILRYLPASILLFLAGVAFAYFTVVPAAFIYLLGVDPEIESRLTYGGFFGDLVVMLAMFGLAFQLPLVTMALARLGIVPAATLRKSRRYAIVVIFIIAALITPSPEPFSQCLLAFPMIGLYELGLFLASRSERQT